MSKSKDSEAAEAILAYLNRQNRPYSVIDIVNNLHKQYGKTAVQKAVESMAVAGKIQEKSYGKQKVYAPNQEQFAEYNEVEIKRMDAEIKQLQEQLRELQESCKSQDSAYKGLKSTMTTEEATAALEEANKKCAVYDERLKKMKSGAKNITPKEKDQIYKDHKGSVQMWKKRKRMATDILNSILEGYPKTKKQLIEDIGLETDEEYGATVPQI